MSKTIDTDVLHALVDNICEAYDDVLRYSPTQVGYDLARKEVANRRATFEGVLATIDQHQIRP
jgi:hypothetical protein